jgi:hypothetical protein
LILYNRWSETSAGYAVWFARGRSFSLLSSCEDRVKGKATS